MDDEVAMSEVAETLDGKVVDEPFEQLPGRVKDEVVKVDCVVSVVTGGDSGSPTLVTLSRLISMSP
jgi:hypothetical protein